MPLRGIGAIQHSWSANRHLRSADSQSWSADWHTHSGPDFSPFLMRFPYFLFFEKYFLSILDYETLSQLDSNSLNLFKCDQRVGEPTLALNLPINLCIKAIKKTVIIYNNHSWPIIKILLIQSHMISIDRFVALILSPRPISLPTSQRGSRL